MKDTMSSCQHALSNDVEYKEVVVIGNGPSGMVTSFMLAGNVPYLTDVPADLPIDEMLRARLENLPKGISLYDVDLHELAEGLEGRSKNPIPLLMDNLLRPCADLGIHAEPLIEWKHDVDKQIEHVVLGRGAPGGAWHSFPASVRTLSPGAWLALPPLPAGAAPAKRLSAAAVAKYCRRYVHACNLTRYFRCNSVVSSVTRASPTRPACNARCPRAATYCVTGYDMSSGRMFRYVCARVVLASGGGERPNTLPTLAPLAIHSLAAFERALHAADDTLTEPRVLVVGSGLSAADAVRAALQRVPHEHADGLFVHHVHRAPPDALARLPRDEYPDYWQVYKMMCEGSSGNYPHYKSYLDHIVLEVDTLPTNPVQPKAEIDHEIHEAIRPKRVKLLNLVTNETSEFTVSIIVVLIGSKPDLFFLQTNFSLNNIDVDGDCNRCLEEKNAKRKIEDERRQCFLRNHWHYIKSVLGQSIQICKSKYLNNSEINGNSDTKCIEPECNKIPVKTKCTCNSTTKTNECYKYDVIPTNKVECDCQSTNPYSNGIGFGLDPKKPVDGRSNPVAIDKSTHELLYAPKGMYALGPLTADNFVRFIPGGALALTAHIHKDRKMST